MQSIIIPTYNRNAELYKCLTCLSHHFLQAGVIVENGSVEIIVSDDARQRSLQEHLASNFPWVNYVEGPSRGPAANRNNGAAQAKGTWLVFTDDDCLPDAEWLSAFQRIADDAPVLEGRTIADRPQQRLDEESPTNDGGYLWSCNFAIKKSLFDSLGGFDEKFPFAAMEDVDLKKRIDDLGEKIIYVPNAVVVHPWRRTNGVAFMKKKQASEFYYWEKHKMHAPTSFPKHYAYRALRSLVKVTIPGAIEFKGRGLKSALEHDAWLFLQAFRFLITRPKNL